LQAVQRARISVVKTGPERPSLRDLLEANLAALAAAGVLPARGERELRIRLDEHGRIRWFEPSRVRAPASELDGGGSVG
jgi:hypothetical protein